MVRQCKGCYDHTSLNGTSLRHFSLFWISSEREDSPVSNGSGQKNQQNHSGAEREGTLHFHQRHFRFVLLVIHFYLLTDQFLTRPIILFQCLCHQRYGVQIYLATDLREKREFETHPLVYSCMVKDNRCMGVFFL